MKCGVVRTYVVSQKPIKLSQGADCSYVQGIKPTLFQSAEMAFYLAFASPITDTGMQQKDSKEYAGQVSNSGRNWAIKVSKRNLDEVFIRISLQSSEFFLIIIEYILEFAGKNFMAIRKCNELLEQQYGNYMELPPKKEQVPHHFVCDFKI